MNHDGHEPIIEGIASRRTESDEIGGLEVENPRTRNLFSVLGTEVDAITVHEVITHAVELIESKELGYMVFCTVSSVISAREHPDVADAMQDAFVVAPDGMPLVWIGRRCQAGPIERVYGPDFLVSFIETTGSQFRHYFYGGGKGTAEAMVLRLQHLFPTLQIAGWRTPPSNVNSARPDHSDLREINESGADIVWVGLGHPKQELWMRASRDLLEAPVLAGVGAAFDFHSGEKKEAPVWMKQSGLQWVHRLSTEPRRLWRRYLIGNSKFLFLLLKGWLSKDFH